MTASADQRLLQLLDIWQASLELHLKYASLDAESYAQVQPWPAHQRPTRWIIDIARQKVLALRTLIEERVQMGDSKFSDALEMTMFLANLVGVQHIERFIPLATLATERVIELTPADTGSMSLTTNAQINLPERLASAVTGTREMPQFVAKTRAPPPAGTAHVARAERSLATSPATAPGDARPAAGSTLPAAAPPTAAPALAAPPVAAPPVAASPVAASPVAGPPVAAPPVAPTPVPELSSGAAPARAARTVARGAARSSGGNPPLATTSRGSALRAGAGTSKSASAVHDRVADGGGEPSAEACAKVLADAERLLQWGRKWYELAELIARMADRPALGQVRRILKENKSALDAKFKR
jgi:hypothetical protein